MHILLLSDSISDPLYKSAITGKLRSVLPKANIDVIPVKPFDKIYSAFILKHTYNMYPKGTFFLVFVYASEVDKFLIIKKNSYFFLLPDIGLITLIFPYKDFDKSRCLTLNLTSFNELAIISYLTEIYQNIDKFPICSKFKETYIPLPIIKPNSLIGKIIYYDTYGNGITNLEYSVLQNFIKRHLEIDIFFEKFQLKFIKHYSEVEKGEHFALINKWGYLEIGIKNASLREYYPESQYIRIIPKTSLQKIPFSII